jgi:hypothetical protein
VISNTENSTSSPAKHQSDRVRDLVGRNHVNPASKAELAAMSKTYGSPEKQSRVEAVHTSSGMKSSLSY